MSKSHIESILEKTRKRLGRRRAEPPGPEIAFIEAFLSRFTTEVIPAIEEAIAREVERACEPLRQRIEECRGERPEAGRSAERRTVTAEPAPEALEARVIEQLAEWLERSVPAPGGTPHAEAPRERWSRSPRPGPAARPREEERSSPAPAPGARQEPAPGSSLRSVEEGQRALLSSLDDLRRCLEGRLDRILERLEDVVLNPGNELA